MHKHVSLLLASITLWLVPNASNAQGISTAAKLVDAPRTLQNTFGQSVSISGNYAVVGTSSEDEDAAGGNTLTEAGAAYVFRNVGGVWNLQQKLVAADRAASDYFGSAVAIDGDYIVVGAQKQDADATGTSPVENAGAAYIFKRDSITGAWNQLQKITAPPSLRAVGDCFGYAVAVSGSAVVVGAYLDNEDGILIGNSTAADAGAVYVFRRSGAAWMMEQKLCSQDRQPGDLFGFSVSISEDDVLVGARLSDLDASGTSPVANAGAAYVFHHNAGAWTQQQKLVAADRAANDAAGYAVAIRGDYAVLGAPQEDEDAIGGSTLSNAGSAYIFHRSGAVWTQAQKLVATDRAAGDRLGFSVALAEDRVLLGAPGEDAAGAGGVDAGATYVFKKTAGAWTQETKIEAADRQGFDEFGKSVAVHDNNLMVGSPTSNLDVVGANPLEDAGAAYLYVLATPLAVKELQLSVATDGLNGCRISWQSSGAEMNSVRYSVARSVDGQNFETLANGAIIQRLANGAYELVDDALPDARQLFYRVAAHHPDGRMAFSNVAILRRSSGVEVSRVSLWPVPVNSTLFVTGGANGDGVIEDVQGRIVARVTLHQGAQVDVSKWPAGLYILRLASGAVARFQKL